MRSASLAALLVSVCFGALLAIRSVAAEDVARSFVASPDVYKVVAENEQYRIIEATWQPGQRDKLHSHGATVASYVLTDCKIRNHLPDVKIVEFGRKPGDAVIRNKDLVHSQKNIGSSVCRIIIFEPK